MQASIRLEHQLLAVEAEHRVHAMLELVAPQGAPSERPPLHVALVVDRSGSMAGEKLDVTKQCASFLVRRLAPTDRFALVTYDDDVRLVAPLELAVPERLGAAIEAIHPGGSTNLSGGWLKGMEELRRARGEGPRRVVLLTDGLANVGVTDPDALAKMAAAAREQGIVTTTIGFGEDFDETLLTEMADAGGGNAHYAETPDQAPGIFAEEFEGLVSLVAQVVSAEIRPSPDVAMVGVLNDSPTVEVPGGVQIQLGDAYAGERRRVVFQLLVPEVASLDVAKVADVVLRYVSVGEEIAAHELTLPITVNLVSADEAARAQADAEVAEEVLVLMVARAQKEARTHADEGDFERASQVLGVTVEALMEAAREASRADDLLEEAEELRRQAKLMHPSMYGPASRKRLLYRSRTTQRRRRKH